MLILAYRNHNQKSTYHHYRFYLSNITYPTVIIRREHWSALLDRSSAANCNEYQLFPPPKKNTVHVFLWVPAARSLFSFSVTFCSKILHPLYRYPRNNPFFTNIDNIILLVQFHYWMCSHLSTDRHRNVPYCWPSQAPKSRIFYIDSKPFN